MFAGTDYLERAGPVRLALGSGLWSSSYHKAGKGALGSFARWNMKNTIVSLNLN